MTSQELIVNRLPARVAELEKLLAATKHDLHDARCRLGELERHLAIAATAVSDATRMGKGGSIFIIDGWNILNTTPLKTKSSLVSYAKNELLSRKNSFVWIVFDGPEEKSATDGAIRITYSGSRGPQRADRLIMDYIHALKFAGVRPAIHLLTNDKPLAASARRALGDRGIVES